MPDARTGSLDALLLYRISRVLAVAGGMVTRLCEGRFGITRREWRVLAALGGHEAMGSSRLAEHAQLDRARTSKAIGSLVAKGLLSRAPAPHDRRQVVLRLTARGSALHDELLPLVSAINQELLDALAPGTAATLDRALHLLQERAERMAEAAVLPRAPRGRRG